jgi:ABC-2 family transporter protein
MFAISYMMVSDSFVLNVIRERQRKVKQQMIISGLNLPAYWLSHYILDVIFSVPPFLCALLGIKIFDLELPQVWVVTLVFILVNPLFIYVFSCRFNLDT